MRIALATTRALVVVTILLLTICGCTYLPLQAERDTGLLQLTDPCWDPIEDCLAEPPVPSPCVPVVPTPCVVPEASQVELPFSLVDAVRVAMELSPVVRIVDGDDIIASGDTFFDIQANQEAVAEALAAFDTTFEATLRGDAFKRPPDAFFGPGLVQPEERDEAAINFGWTRRNAMGGEASLKYNPNPGYLFIPGESMGFNPRHIGELEFTVKQPLLKGAGTDVNLAPLKVARINVDQSDWVFKKALMSSVQGAVAAYWDLHAAQVAVEAVEEVIPLLEEVLRIQTEAFKAQWVTETEVAKAEAQMYEFRQQHEALLSQRFEAELRLRNLIGMSPQDGRKLVTSTNPLDQLLTTDLEQSLLAALDNQPDLVNQWLNVRLRAIDRRLALNGRRLQLDVFGIIRRNGIDEDLGSAVTQMLTRDFTDWQFGAQLTVPLGRRQAEAAIRAADQRMAREQALLDQQMLTTQHNIQNALRGIEYAFRQYEQSKKRLESAEKWVAGAKLRYQNPNVVTGGSNVLVTNLNEYLNSLRFRLEAATERAQLIAAYNSEIVRLEEEKGTLLDFLLINLRDDPCSISADMAAPPVGEMPTRPGAVAEEGAAASRVPDSDGLDVPERLPAPTEQPGHPVGQPTTEPEVFRPLGLGADQDLRPLPPELGSD